MEAHHIINQRTYLEVKRSKFKVTRPINAVTDGIISHNNNNDIYYDLLLPSLLYTYEYK